MNKRIEELAYDADLLDKFRYGYFDPKLQKFAELIIRESIDTVLDSSVEYTTRPQVAEELKEHFGVK